MRNIQSDRFLRVQLCADHPDQVISLAPHWLYSGRPPELDLALRAGAGTRGFRPSACRQSLRSWRRVDRALRDAGLA